MPTPQSGESRDEFVSRCIPEVLRDETAESQEQAVAICFDIWRRRDNQATDDDSRYMTLRGLAQTAQLRTATFREREHLVLPVVAMVGNSIVRPKNSEDAELVPSEVLRRAPVAWDGRPVVIGHPTDGNGSANRPRTLENMSFGQLFNTRFHDGRLKTEAWIDVEAARALGGDSRRVLERVRNHETVEVSIGAWITGEHVDDTGGFGFVWKEAVPDHLAMLPEGTKGACSVDMGCGAPLVMSKREHTSTHIKKDPGVAQLRHSWMPRALSVGRLLISAGASKEDNLKNNKEGEQGVLSRFPTFQSFLQYLGVLASAESRHAQDEGMSDTELRSALHDALRDDVPAFEGIIDVFPDTGVVVFVATQEGEFQWFHRTFSVAEDGSVGLNDDMQAVEPVTEFKPVTASEEGAHSCECEGECKCAHVEDGDEPSGDKNDEPVAARRENGGAPAATKGTTPKEDVTMSKQLKALVGRLIINEDTPFTGDHEETLLAMPEDTLKSLEEKYNEEPFIKPEPDPEPEPMTEEEWMETAPPSIREMVRRYQDEESERRNLLINSLARAQNQFTKKQLESKSTEDLEALCGLCKINAPKKDYSGRGLAAAFADANAEGVPSPPNMQRYIQAKRSGKSNHEAMREARSA